MGKGKLLIELESLDIRAEDPGPSGHGRFRWDDFTTNWEGNAWLATHQNMLTEIKMTVVGADVTSPLQV